MKKILTRIFFATTLAAVLVAGSCDFNNSFIDEWWEESPVDDDGGDDDGQYLFTQETFVVSFDSRGGNYIDSINGDSPDVSPQRVWAHAHASVPGLVARENSFFTGWYKDTAYSDDWDFATDEANPTNDGFGGAEVDNIITLYAGWADNGFTVDFNINPPESDFGEVDLTYMPLQESIADGSRAAEPLQFGIKPDTRYATKYVFIGWYKTEEAANAPLTNQTSKWNFAIDTVTKKETLYAGWAEILDPLTVYTVTFFSDADKNSPPKQYVMSGESVIAPYVTYRNGYTFGGWYKDDAYKDDWDFTTDTVTADITLYAKWAPVDPVDVLKDVNIVDFRYILFSGGQTEFNASAATGSSTNLTPLEKDTNTDEITKIVAYLSQNPNYRVMVVGHANPVSEADKANPQNEELTNLSQARADAVKEQIEANLGGSQYDLTKTPIKTRAEGGRRAMQQPMLSRRVEIIVFDITTESVTP